MPESVDKLRRWLHSLVEIPKGSVVLDLGCGNGEDLANWSAESDSCFVGMDLGAPAPLRPGIHLVQADAAGPLPFGSASVDVIYSVNLLECISDKQSLLQDCARVLKPNGRMLFAHWDWDTLTFDGEDKALTRKIVQTFADWKQDWMGEIDPWMGRRLWKTFQECQLFEGRIENYTLVETEFCEGQYGFQHAQSFSALARRGLVRAENLERFHSDQTKLYDRNQYFFSLGMFAFVGQLREGSPPTSKAF